MTRSVLLVVLPHRLANSLADVSKKAIRSYLAFPYGVLTIASYLNRYAKNLGAVEILDLNLPGSDTPEKALERKLMAMRPDIVGFSMSYDVSFPWLQRLLAIARHFNPWMRLIAGGPAVTTAHAELLAQTDLDACCYSEGEVGLKNLVEADDLDAALRQAPWVTRAKPSAATLYGDLDEIVNVDYGLVDIDAYSMKEAFSPFTKFNTAARQFFIVTSRGCPFRCVFCAEPSFHGANMRYVSVDRAVDHVAMLKDRYGLTVLTIYDDQILMAHARAKEFFRKIAPLNIRVEMPNGVTLSYIDEEMATLMRAAGVDTVHLAIEHGSARVLKDIIKKPIAVKKIKPTIQILQAAGIYCQAFFVIGLPGETRAERQETRDAILDWGVDWASFNYATPLRGSELFRMCRDKGWVDPKYLEIGAIDMTEYVIKAPGMDKAEIEDFVFNANLDVNFVHNRNMRVGRYEVARAAFFELTERHPGQAFAHYYVGECDSALDRDGGASYDRFFEIINQSPVWRAASRRFGLTEPRVATSRDGARQPVEARA